MIEIYYAMRNMSSGNFILKLGDTEIVPEADGLSVEITLMVSA
jgi:hypothetical protein